MDRNAQACNRVCQRCASLSARRAWIEMYTVKNQKLAEAVALRKESVDRNISNLLKIVGVEESLSARRAWIEMH